MTTDSNPGTENVIDVTSKIKKSRKRPRPTEIDREAEIERLAALGPIDYEVARVDAAERLGIRANILDKEVAKKRRKLGLVTTIDDGQGRAVVFPDPMPWHEPVNGDELASDLTRALKRTRLRSGSCTHGWSVRSRTRRAWL
jgi:ribosome-binding ATPase YchF (GTP1/OBG family)